MHVTSYKALRRSIFLHTPCSFSMNVILGENIKKLPYIILKAKPYKDQPVNMQSFDADMNTLRMTFK